MSDRSALGQHRLEHDSQALAPSFYSPRWRGAAARDAGAALVRALSPIQLREHCRRVNLTHRSRQLR
jgi:hypothetical protein